MQPLSIRTFKHYHMTRKDFVDHLKEEQAFYDTSMKARIGLYPSYYMGKYLKYMRLIEFIEENTPPHTLSS